MVHYMGEGKNEKIGELKQSKCRNRKVFITDVAVDKVPLIQYKGLTGRQNRIMRKLAQEVLIVAKNENDSNEVALTCDLGTENPLEVYGISFGTEHEVDIRADTLSNHILVSQKSVAVVILHNHPSTRTFSMQDIRFFIEFPTIEIMVVVSNQGTVHYLKRESDYDERQAVKLFQMCARNLNKTSGREEIYQAALMFLEGCNKMGIYYC